MYKQQTYYNTSLKSFLGQFKHNLYRSMGQNVSFHGRFFYTIMELDSLINLKKGFYAIFLAKR